MFLQEIKMWPIFTLFLLVRCAWCEINQCDPITGSSGTTDCIRLYSYNNEYQWVTCLKNSYIKQKTNHSARCVDPLAKDCWCQVWWRCSIKILVQWKRLAPVRLEESWHPICHRAVLAHLEINVTGTATALKKTILAKTQPMPTPYDTLRRFARCMKGKEPCSMRKDKNGWMLPVGVCKLIWCRWCVRGYTQLVTRYGNGPSQLIFHAFLTPDQNVSSICDLNCTDYLRIFWTIRGSFSRLGTAWESIKG